MNDYTAFEEKQYTDIWSNDDYLQFMYERLILLRELLSDGGSIYVHCDWHKGHYLRCMMDEIFGVPGFRNEISWTRTASHNDQADRFSRVRDTILFYSKGKPSTFNIQYMPYTAEYIASEWNQLPSGRYYKSENMLDPQGKMKSWDFHGTVARWRSTPDKMEELWNAPQTEVPNSHGRIKLGKNGAPIKRCRIMFLDEMPGVPMSDVWTDISYVAGGSDESENYPTQKPRKLIERIIATSSRPGDLVLDCFMGSGTTQEVAMRLGLRFIGADINLGAVQITTKRLLHMAASLSAESQQLSFDEPNAPALPETLYTGFELYNVNHYDVFRNPVEAKDILLQALEVNRLQAGQLFDGEKDGRMVKVMPVNRIATRQDLNELINGFDYKAFERQQAEHPNQPVERITLVCMGHEPDLAAWLKQEVPYNLDVDVVDVLRDKQDLQFKRDSEARVAVQGKELVIERFYPMNLLSKLSIEAEGVDDWRTLVDSVMIDWNYDGAVLQPTVADIPDDGALVAGRYPIPADAGTIRVKITDLLSESLEVTVRHG